MAVGYELLQATYELNPCKRNLAFALLRTSSLHGGRTAPPGGHPKCSPWWCLPRATTRATHQDVEGEPVTQMITRDDALRTYPQLRALLEFSPSSQWIFRYIENGAGEVVALAGSRSLQRYTDAIFILGPGEVGAARVLDEAYGGGCIWQRDGGDLQEVIYDLLGLPEPGEVGAPTLVKASGSLWTP